MSRHGPSCQPRFDVTEVHFAKGPLKQGCGFGWIRLFWSNSNVLIRSGFQRKGWSSLNIKIQNPYKIKFFSSIVSLLYKRGSFVRPLLGHIWSFFEDRYWIRLFFKDLSRIRVFFFFEGQPWFAWNPPSAILPLSIIIFNPSRDVRAGLTPLPSHVSICIYTHCLSPHRCSFLLFFLSS